MSSDAPNDVPSPIDFSDLEQAKAWVTNTVRARPWRPRFFKAFADAINEEVAKPHNLVELGSGPGHLAEVILCQCPVETYVAIDFSPAMHALAQEHLGDLAGRVTFSIRDFREPTWAAGLEGADVVVTHQAAHEVRHKEHLPGLFGSVHKALRPGGLFLICDHYWEQDVPWKNVPLYLAKEDQLAKLAEAGFEELRTLWDEGGMQLIRARRR